MRVGTSFIEELVLFYIPTLRSYIVRIDMQIPLTTSSLINLAMLGVIQSSGQSSLQIQIICLPTYHEILTLLP